MMTKKKSPSQTTWYAADKCDHKHYVLVKACLHGFKSSMSTTASMRYLSDIEMLWYVPVSDISVGPVDDSNLSLDISQTEINLKPEAVMLNIEQALPAKYAKALSKYWDSVDEANRMRGLILVKLTIPYDHRNDYFWVRRCHQAGEHVADCLIDTICALQEDLKHLTHLQAVRARSILPSLGD